MKAEKDKVVYDRVFVLAGEMEKTNGGHKFLEEDKSGFIHGETRYDAIKIFKKQGRVKEIIFVGGPVKNDQTTNKAKLMKKWIGAGAKALESKSNTKDNIRVIKEHLDKKKLHNEKNGLLTQFYHLPRILRLVKDEGLKLTPICAEAILLAERPSKVREIKEWYSHPSMAHRIYCEIHGLRDIEMGEYGKNKK